MVGDQMSHFFTCVLIPGDTASDDVHEAVERLLAPWSEEVSDSGKWDWWVIGGRYTGAFDGYQPELDPANIETCAICHGTGTRPDADRFGTEWAKETGGCNGCGGKGAAVKWPTQWVEHAGDTMPVRQLPESFGCFAVVDLDGNWHDRENPEWWRLLRAQEYEAARAVPLYRSDADWIAEWSKILSQHQECLAVAVDCHR